MNLGRRDIKAFFANHHGALFLHSQMHYGFIAYALEAIPLSRVGVGQGVEQFGNGLEGEPGPVHVQRQLAPLDHGSLVAQLHAGQEYGENPKGQAQRLKVNPRRCWVPKCVQGEADESEDEKN
jgi:hypothetical protein